MDDVLARCLAGHKQAWDEFVDRYARVILAAVRRVLQGRGVAGEDQAVEDVVQDVFVRLIGRDYRLLRGYDPARASLSTWLTIVARSTAIDFLRRRRHPTVPLEAAGQVESAPAGPDAEALAEVPAGLLTARQRLVLGLLFDRGLDGEEVARLLGIAPQTVRSTKHKAIQKLREHFSTEGFS